MALQNAVGDGDASHIALNVQVVVTSDVKDDLLTKAESAGIRRSPTCRVAAPRPRVLRPHSPSHHGLKPRTLQGFLQIGRQTHQRIMKVCSTCEKKQPLEAFYRQKGGAQRRRARCKECYRAETRAAYARNSDLEALLAAKRASSSSHNLTRYPLEPPPSQQIGSESTLG